MSDIENKELELEDGSEPEDESYVTLTDDEGNDVSFEWLDRVEYSGRSFAVLLPFDEEDDGIVILELLPGGDPEYEEFVSVDDEKLLTEVYEEFKKNYEGEYDFE